MSEFRSDGGRRKLATPPLPPSSEPAIRETPLLEQSPYRKESGIRPAVVPEGSRIEAAVFDRIVQNIADFDKRQKEHEDSIRLLLGSLDAAQINNLRYRLFAPHYDTHMESHERAIDILLRQLVDVEKIAFTDQRLVHDDILEMSCGTGTVIKLLCSAMEAQRVRQMRFVANDISEDMMAVAREKLSGLPVTFTSHDINELSLPAEPFRSVILSQTLHLITDEDVVRQERKDNYMYVGEDRHLDKKFCVISDAWRNLPEGGTFILIDEWPAMLSDRGGPLGPGFAYLFNDGLREISRDSFQNSIMDQMPCSRFVAQLKAPIDGKHQMYLIVYRKEHKTGNSRIPVSPDFAQVRREAFEKVLQIFKTIDRDFIDSIDPSNGEPWIKFLPINEGVKIISNSNEMPSEENENNCVVIRQCMHGIDNYDRYDLIARSVASLKLGGSLIIIDEWNPPDGTKHSLRLGSLKPVYLNRFTKHLVFAGSVRVPISPLHDSGMYGFEYRKVF
jgi:SAM-dependent methyltransferase